MKIARNEQKKFQHDALLGGAALTSYDLLMIESREIQWLLVGKSDDDKSIYLRP